MMTENTVRPSMSGPPETAPFETPTTVSVVKEQAASTGQSALEGGQDVATSAMEQVGHVASEAGDRAKDLLFQARGELASQAGAQQQRLVQGLHSLGEELRAMAGQAPRPGIASNLAQQGAGKTQDIASWLGGRDPEQLLDELHVFARRRPGAFLAVALGAGLVAGRLTRGVKDAAGDPSVEGESGQGSVDSITLPASEPYVGVSASGVVGAMNSSAGELRRDQIPGSLLGEGYVASSGDTR